MNKSRGEKTSRWKTVLQIGASAIYSSYHVGVSLDYQVGRILLFFLEAFCAQTNIFWHEIKINKMFTKI